jgi:hypothetical protein
VELWPRAGETFWEPVSGIKGDPRNGGDAITMMLWALENGYIQRWSCANEKHEGLI